MKTIINSDRDNPLNKIDIIVTNHNLNPTVYQTARESIKEILEDNINDSWVSAIQLGEDGDYIFYSFSPDKHHAEKRVEYFRKRASEINYFKMDDFSSILLFSRILQGNNNGIPRLKFTSNQLIEPFLAETRGFLVFEDQMIKVLEVFSTLEREEIKEVIRAVNRKNAQSDILNTVLNLKIANQKMSWIMNERMLDDGLLLDHRMISRDAYKLFLYLNKKPID